MGGTGGQGLDGLGRQAGFGRVAETREAGKGPEPGHRLARDPSGQPSNPSIEKSDEPGLALLGSNSSTLVLTLTWRPGALTRRLSIPHNSTSQAGESRLDCRVTRVPSCAGALIALISASALIRATDSWVVPREYS